MKKMYELPFIMLIQKDRVDIERIPGLPDFENEFSKNYALEYLALYRELAFAINNDNEEALKFLRPKISKLAEKGVKNTARMSGNDSSELAGWFIELMDIY